MRWFSFGFLIFIAFLKLSPAQADINYHPAFEAFKNASLIQTGIQARIDELKRSAAVKGQSVLRQLGIGNEFGTMAFAYQCFRDRAVALPMGDGRMLTLREGEVRVDYRFPF